MQVHEIDFMNIGDNVVERIYEDIDIDTLNECNSLAEASIYIKDNIKINRNMKFSTAKTIGDICNDVDFMEGNRFVELNKLRLLTIGKKLKFDIFRRWVKQFIIEKIPKAFVITNLNFNRYGVHQKVGKKTLSVLHLSVKELKIFDLIGSELNEVSLEDLKKINTIDINMKYNDCFRNWETEGLKIISLKPDSINPEAEKVTRVFAMAFVNKMMHKHNCIKPNTISIISYTKSRELSKSLSANQIFTGLPLSAKKLGGEPVYALMTKLRNGEPVNYMELYAKFKKSNPLSKFQQIHDIELGNLSIRYKM